MTASFVQGLLQLPSELMRRYGLRENMRIEIEETKEGILIRPGDAGKPRRSLHDLVGFLGEDPRALTTLMDERRRDSERENQRGS